jgi:branched-chain amino acid transport system permease protein
MAPASSGSRPGRRWLAAPGLILVFLPLLAACGERISDQQRLCQLLIEPLVPEPARPDPIVSELQPPTGTTVIAGYSTRDGRTGWIACGYERPSGPFAPLEIARIVTSDRGEIGPIELFLLRTYWLPRSGPGSQEGVDGRPRPPLEIALQHGVNALTPIGLYVLLAMGISMIYAHTGRFHLALGDLGMVGAYAALPILILYLGGMGEPQLGAALAIAMVAGAVIGAGWSALSGHGPIGRSWQWPGMAPLVAMIGLSLALREGVRLAQRAREPWLPPMLPGPFEVSFGRWALVVSTASLLVPIVALLAWASLTTLLHHTSYGRGARACADDLTMASLVGLRPERIRAGAFALAGGCAGLAATLVLLVYGTIGVEGGFGLALKGITAAVLGGLGSLSGAVLGGIVIGMVETFWAGYLGGGYRDVAVFVILVLLLVLRPSGLLPRPPLRPNDRFRPF